MNYVPITERNRPRVKAFISAAVLIACFYITVS